MLQGNEAANRRARGLRKAMSLPEVLLWQHLKGRHDDVKFRRQHPAGEYIVDFYCHQARIVIEIDGISHDMGNRPAHDKRRDAWLAASGLTVHRIPAGEVLRDPQEVARSIVTLCSAACSRAAPVVTTSFRSH